MKNLQVAEYQVVIKINMFFYHNFRFGISSCGSNVVKSLKKMTPQYFRNVK